MARICDRSPCDKLLAVLGKYVFGSNTDEEPGFFIAVLDDEDEAVSNKMFVDYCPFCGTRLEEVPGGVIDRFTKSRKRRRAIKNSTE